MLSDFNFNLNPYYDDFNEAKGYYRILFKPGFAVQARELTQLQTQLQDQISKFGDHIFREGSVVLGGNPHFSSVSYIDVSRNNALANFDNQTFTGQTSGAKGKVVKTKVISDTVARIYFSYSNGLVFRKNESVVCDNLNTETTVNADTFLGDATTFSVEQGVFYIYGNFVYCEPQTIVIAEDEPATCRVGLFAEEVIKNSNQDTSLLDPALNSYNYSAPGADRYAISLTLTSFAYDPAVDNATENGSDNFIEISRFVNGEQTTLNKIPLYSEIENTLARRTYDESGDYTVRAFGVKIVDHVYGNTDLLSVQVEPGKAYVRGYEFETIAPTYVDLPRARTTEFENEFPVYVNYGQYFYIKGLSKGTFDYTNNQIIDLTNSSNLTTANVIGNCRVKYIEYDSDDFDSSVYRLYVDQVNIFDPANNSTNNIVSLNTATFQANIASNSYTTSINLQGNDNTSYIIKIPKDYVASVNSAETSYETLIKVPDNASFATGNTTLDNSGPSNQVFLGSGTLNEADTRALYHVVVATSTNTSVIAVGTVLDYDTHQLRVTVVDEDTLQMSTNVAVNFTATVFAKVSISGAIRKTKTKSTDTVVISGASLTVANLSNKISLTKSDCIELLGVTAYSNTGAAFDYTSYYEFDTGQTDVLYDHGSITLKPGYPDPITDGAANLVSGNVTVAFSYYTHSGTSSGFFNVDSYPTYDEVGTYTSSTGEVYNLKNCFDFRPRRTDGANTVTGGLWAEPSTLLTTDFNYYVGRIDKLVLTKERKLTLVQGIPAVYPSVPVDLPDSMNLFIINVPPYTANKEEVTYTFIENKRYTMRDIGKIEKRVERLEYYTTLSLLEKQAKDESIPSDVPTIDRFKNGILVDSFAGHSVGDVSSPDYACSVDYVNRILRPRFSSQAYTFNFTSGTNHKKSGDLITLDYSTETFINQPLVSRTVNLNPYAVFQWNGFVELDPPSDNWIDTSTRPDVVVNLNGENDVYTILANTVTNPTSSGVRWSDWRTIVNGVPQTTSQQSTSSAVGTSVVNGRTLQTTTTTTIDNQTTTVSSQLARVGLDISTGAVQTVTRDLGTKIVDISIIPFIRSRIINFSAKSLKPSTNLFALFDGTDVTRYCTPAVEIILHSANVVNQNATSISFFTGNTAVTAEIVAKRKDRIFVKERSTISNVRFQTGNTFYWIVNNTINTTPIVANTVVNRTTLTTNERGDIAGFFAIPNNDLIKFRTGERTFKLSDTVGQGGSTAAATKYVALGLSQSTEKTLVSTRVATVSVNPVLDFDQRTSSASRTITSTNVRVVDITPPPPPPPPPPPTIGCSHNENGGVPGTYTYIIDFGTDTGVCGIDYNNQSPVPDSYTITWDGNEYTTGFVGQRTFNQQLRSAGRSDVVGSGNGLLTFNKTKAQPSTAILRVDAPLAGTAWRFRVICPAPVVVPPPEPPPPVTTPTLDFTITPPADATFSALFGLGIGGSLERVQATCRVDTSGTSAQFVRISSFTVSAVDDRGLPVPIGAPTGVFPFWTNQDLQTNTTSTEGRRRSGTATNAIQIIRLGRNNSTYTVTLSATATLYEDVSRTISTGLTKTATATFIVRQNDGAFAVVDPVAQTFFVDAGQYPNGIFLDSVDLYFKKKSTNLPVTLELRPTVNGYPSAKDIIPFSVVNLLPGEVNISDDASIATNFKFQSPVYLPPGEHSFVAKCNTDEYEIFSAVLGEFQLTNPDIRITQQPTVGSMFKSQNASTWTPVQEEDVMFKINKCVFNTGAANAATATLNVNMPSTGNVVYDVFFADGEMLDFAATNIDYYYKTTNQSDLIKDTSNTRYQLGSNAPMSERKIVRSGQGSDIDFLTVLSTEDRNVTPVVDLSRLSTVLVQNIVNNAGLRADNFLISDFGSGYSSNANVAITADSGSGAAAIAYYNANTGRIEIQMTSEGSGYTGNVTATITGGGATANAQVIVQNEIGNQGGNALARYVSRKVTLAPGFESLDLKLYFLANLPTGTSVKVYYKAAPITTVFFDNEPWREMILESSGNPSETGFVDYKYKTSTNNALPGDEKFKTFSIKIVMLSNNPVRVPQIRDLRVIALDE